jgi:hypothetical protein
MAENRNVFKLLVGKPEGTSGMVPWIILSCFYFRSDGVVRLQIWASGEVL